MTSLRKLLLLLILPFAIAACHRSADPAHGAQTTETIPPAAAQPAANGTDAMTQTVEVGDSRSEAEGGTATMTQPAKTAGAKKAPAKKKK